MPAIAVPSEVAKSTVTLLVLAALSETVNQTALPSWASALAMETVGSSTVTVTV